MSQLGRILARDAGRHLGEARVRGEQRGELRPQGRSAATIPKASGKIDGTTEEVAEREQVCEVPVL